MYLEFRENRFFKGGGANFHKSSLVLIITVLDPTNWMAQPVFKNFKYSMSYVYFMIVSPEKHFPAEKKNLPES